MVIKRLTILTMRFINVNGKKRIVTLVEKHPITLINVKF